MSSVRRYAIECLATFLAWPLSAFATRSIVACDPVRGECGVAVVSNPYGAGTWVPLGDVGAAAAVQGQGDQNVSRALIVHLNAGMEVSEALAQALTLAGDNRPNLQVGVAALRPSDKGVEVASFTGASLGDANACPTCLQICSVTGSTYTVNANMQSSSAVCQAMADAFEAAAGQQLARRLHRAVIAGASVGHDNRGEYAAALKVWNGSFWNSWVTLLASSTIDFSLDWMSDLTFGMEAWLLYWQVPGDPAEQVPLTRDMTKRILFTLRSLGYYRHGSLDRWSDRAEQALQSWALTQLGWEIPTSMIGGTRMVERSLAYVLLYGTGRNYLIRAPEQ
jgi:uncharacterized Ntn-hydrolase superfamily protein